MLCLVYIIIPCVLRVVFAWPSHNDKFPFFQTSTFLQSYLHKSSLVNATNSLDVVKGGQLLQTLCLLILLPIAIKVDNSKIDELFIDSSLTGTWIFQEYLGDIKHNNAQRIILYVVVHFRGRGHLSAWDKEAPFGVGANIWTSSYRGLPPSFRLLTCIGMIINLLLLKCAVVYNSRLPLWNCIHHMCTMEST